MEAWVIHQQNQAMKTSGNFTTLVTVWPETYGTAELAKKRVVDYYSNLDNGDWNIKIWQRTNMGFPWMVEVHKKDKSYKATIKLYKTTFVIGPME